MMSNIVFQLIACPFGLVYQITPDGAYTRGDFYIVYLTYVVISAVFAINSAIIFSKRFESTDYITLIVIIALVGVGCFAQYLNPGLKTAYVCVALAAMLFYIYSDDLIQKALVKQTQEQMEKASQTQHKLIVGLAEIIETRDENTGHHISRTVQYVKVLATRAQNSGNYTLLTDDYVNMMLQCAFLHDVGKIAIPDAILNKPGKLTDEEFDVIKTHTIEGGRIIESILGETADPDYLACGTEIATFHHEKWDGSGYPAGLSGESIPVCARIMAIADVYDALTTERPYKKAMSTDEALEIIRKGSGTHFDPELAQMFLDSEDQIRRASLGLSYAAA